MPMKSKPGSADWVDPDDAPHLTAEMRDQAEVFDGDRFIQRGRGRPKAEVVKEQVNIRLDARAVDYLRASGPGWQTRTSEIIGENIDEASLPRFEFPVEVAVTLPGGDIAHGVGQIVIRAPDAEEAVRKFEYSPRANRLRALMNVTWTRIEPAPLPQRHVGQGEARSRQSRG